MEDQAPTAPFLGLFQAPSTQKRRSWTRWLLGIQTPSNPGPIIFASSPRPVPHFNPVSVFPFVSGSSLRFLPWLRHSRAAFAGHAPAPWCSCHPGASFRPRRHPGQHALRFPSVLCPRLTPGRSLVALHVWSSFSDLILIVCRVVPPLLFEEFFCTISVILGHPEQIRVSIRAGERSSLGSRSSGQDTLHVRSWRCQWCNRVRPGLRCHDYLNISSLGDSIRSDRRVRQVRTGGPHMFSDAPSCLTESSGRVGPARHPEILGRLSRVESRSPAPFWSCCSLSLITVHFRGLHRLVSPLTRQIPRFFTFLCFGGTPWSLASLDRSLSPVGWSCRAQEKS